MTNRICCATQASAHYPITSTVMEKFCVQHLSGSEFFRSTIRTWTSSWASRLKQNGPWRRGATVENDYGDDMCTTKRKKKPSIPSHVAVHLSVLTVGLLPLVPAKFHQVHGQYLRGPWFLPFYISRKRICVMWARVVGLQEKRSRYSIAQSDPLKNVCLKECEN